MKLMYVIGNLVSTNIYDDSPAARKKGGTGAERPPKNPPSIAKLSHLLERD